MPLGSLKPKDKVVVPRNFRLLEELEEIEKSQGGMVNGISYGLEGYDDNILLERWTGIILGQQYQNLYNLKIYCPMEYPQSPPIVTFIDSERPNTNIIDQNTGQINSNLPLIKAWREEYRIKDLLQEIRKYL